RLARAGARPAGHAGAPAGRLGDAPGPGPPAAPAEQTRPSRRRVDEQPAVIVFAGHDPDRLARLRHSVAASRAAALDYFRREDWEQYAGWQRDDVVRRLFSGTGPERRPGEGGAALLWDHVTRVAEPARRAPSCGRRG